MLNNASTYNNLNGRPRQGGITITFPMKLHIMLMEVSRCEVRDTGAGESSLGIDFSHIIHWNPEGNNFIVKKPKEFTEMLLPKYFRTHKFSSFQRQLNAYGFTRGNPYAGQEDLHIYQHDFFHRDHPERLRLIKRRSCGNNILSGVSSGRGSSKGGGNTRRRVGGHFQNESLKSSSGRVSSKKPQKLEIPNLPAILSSPTFLRQQNENSMLSQNYDQNIDRLLTSMVSPSEILSASTLGGNYNHPSIHNYNNISTTSRQDLILEAAMEINNMDSDEIIPPVIVPSYSLNDWNVEKETLRERRSI